MEKFTICSYMSYVAKKVLTIKDIKAGEKPFLYSTGNWGPGYIMIKGLVAHGNIMRMMCQTLSDKILSSGKPDFVVGNVTGGMIPGWELARNMGVQFVYARDMRKKGGHHELITGLSNNNLIKPGTNCLIVEELVNFAGTTCNSAIYMKEKGYVVTDAACILFYDNPEARKSMEDIDIEMTCLFTLRELLEHARKIRTHKEYLIDSYLEFLDNPLKWQKDRGLEPVKSGGTK